MSTSTRSQAIDAVLAQAVASGAVPNVVAIGATRSGIAYEGAAGSRAPGADGRVDADTPFRIMSMTKLVVTVAALRLRDQLKLDIDAPVEEYCPEFAAVKLLEGIADGQPVLRAPSRKVTVKQLITHTSGFGYWFWNVDVAAWERAVNAPKSMSGLRAVLNAPLVAEPGTAFLYGNGTDWLGLVVEAVIGQRLDDAISALMPETVDEMFSNQIGGLDFPAETHTTDPGSACGLAVGPGYKWGHGLLINTRDQPGRRRAGSGAWMGLFNTYFWVDPTAGVTGAVFTQLLPLLAPETVRMYEGFESALYASL